MEVDDAQAASASMGFAPDRCRRVDTATGVTMEVDDPWGNVLGFADCRFQPELGRKG